jgi:bifunctional non-homologous end joining protein LigD
VRRDGEAVRLFTRRGYDWTDRYPAISNAAAKLKARSFTLDGEAVVAGADGVAVFDALHRRGRVTDAILQAFDLLELDGVDYRPLPLRQRKDRLARLLARVQVGIAINEHTDEDGAVVFLHACKMGLEGIVSKRLTAPYRSGPSRDWIKIKKNRTAPQCGERAPGFGNPQLAWIVGAIRIILPPWALWRGGLDSLAEDKDARLPQTLPDALRDLSPLPPGIAASRAQCMAHCPRLTRSRRGRRWARRHR